MNTCLKNNTFNKSSLEIKNYSNLQKNNDYKIQLL